MAPAPAAVERRRVNRAARCFDCYGRLQRWPAREAEQLLTLWVLWSYLPDGRFSEPEINSMLRDWNDFEDYALLRRHMCDRGLLQRTPDGRIYRRVAHDMPPEAAAVMTAIAAVSPNPAA